MLLQAILATLTNQTTWVALEAIAVMITVAYAILQYREVRGSRKQQERPYVIVDFEVTDWLIDVAVVNIGAGAAIDVKFSFNPDLINSADMNLSQSFWLFKQGAHFLPSNKRITTFFDSGNQYFGAGKPLAFDTNISYKDTRGDSWTTSMKLDLSMYKGQSYVRRKGLDDIARTLEKLAQRK